jgi:hypothetical protein
MHLKKRENNGRVVNCVVGNFSLLRTKCVSACSFFWSGFPFSHCLQITVRCKSKSKVLVEGRYWEIIFKQTDIANKYNDGFIVCRLFFKEKSKKIAKIRKKGGNF